MPNILLGSEVIIISVDDARKLLQVILLESDEARLKRLQKRGLLDLLGNLRDVIRQHDYEVDNA